MNTTILFYNGESGYAVTGRLAGGRWEEGGTGGSVLALAVGYTHAAASSDTLILYNDETGVGENGTFKDGEYHQMESNFILPFGYTHVEATGDSVLFYNKNTGKGESGTLQNGEYTLKRRYGDFSKQWWNIAGSSDTMVFARYQGPIEFRETVLGYGKLKEGIYTHAGTTTENGVLEYLTATKDSVLALRKSGSTSFFHVTTATDGSLGTFREVGTAGAWDMVGRTADSLFFYKIDGTAWASTLSGGSYANVGAISNVLPSTSGWSIIEGGV